MSNQTPKKSLPWFAKGLRFCCTECGKCCTGAPGYVWVTEDEIERIATYLDMPTTAFREKYVRKIGNRFSLVEDPQTFSCPFLKEKRCTIYPTRPKQCQTFPWWLQNLRSEKAFNDAAKICEGINHPEGKLYSSEEILTQITESPL